MNSIITQAFCDELDKVAAGRVKAILSKAVAPVALAACVGPGCKTTAPKTPVTPPAHIEQVAKKSDVKGRAKVVERLKSGRKAQKKEVNQRLYEKETASPRIARKARDHWIAKKEFKSVGLLNRRFHTGMEKAMKNRRQRQIGKDTK